MMSLQPLTELALCDHIDLLVTPDGEACDEETSRQTVYKHEDVPPWFNEEKFKQGQKFYHKHIYSMFIGKLCGLLCTLTIPSMLKILIFTKQSSTVETAYRRYVSTILHMDKWYSSEFKPESQLWKSLLHVRKKHFYVSYLSEKNGCGRITQRDMALTQFGFIGYAIIRTKQLGIKVESESELEGFVHFWRVIGWILGIDDKYNLCRNSLIETQVVCEYLLNILFLPALRRPDLAFVYMSRNLLQAMRLVYPLLHPNAFLGFTYYLANYLDSKSLSDLGVFSIWMSDMDKMVYVGMFRIIAIIYNRRLIKIFFNLQMRLAIFLVKFFPFLAMFRFGFKKSFVNIYK